MVSERTFVLDNPIPGEAPTLTQEYLCDKAREIDSERDYAMCDPNDLARILKLRRLYFEAAAIVAYAEAVGGYAHDWRGWIAHGAQASIARKIGAVADVRSRLTFELRYRRLLCSLPEDATVAKRLYRGSINANKTAGLIVGSDHPFAMDLEPYDMVAHPLIFSFIADGSPHATLVVPSSTKGMVQRNLAYLIGPTET